MKFDGGTAKYHLQINALLANIYNFSLEYIQNATVDDFTEEV